MIQLTITLTNNVEEYKLFTTLDWPGGLKAIFNLLFVSDRGECQLPETFNRMKKKYLSQIWDSISKAPSTKTVGHRF